MIIAVVITWVLVGIGMVMLIRHLRVLEGLGQDSHGVVNQRHHGYIGAAVAIAASLATLIPGLPVWAIVILWIVAVLGLWWLGDDVYQHGRQRKEPGYRSSWHRFAAKYKVI